MGSLHQDTAWGCYPGVFDQGQGQLLLKIDIQYPLNNFNLFWPIDTKLAVWVAYIKRQLGIATQVSLVKVTVTKNRNSVDLFHQPLFLTIYLLQCFIISLVLNLYDF